MLGFYWSLTYLGEEKYLTLVSNSLPHGRREIPNTSSLQPSMWETGNTQPQAPLAILSHLRGEKKTWEAWVKFTWKYHFQDRKHLLCLKIPTGWKILRMEQTGSYRGWGQRDKGPVYAGLLGQDKVFGFYSKCYRKTRAIFSWEIIGSDLSFKEEMLAAV